MASGTHSDLSPRLADRIPIVVRHEITHAARVLALDLDVEGVEHELCLSLDLAGHNAASRSSFVARASRVAAPFDRGWLSFNRDGLASADESARFGKVGVGNWDGTSGCRCLADVGKNDALRTAARV